jgi:hypothetical protein
MAYMLVDCVSNPENGISNGQFGTRSAMGNPKATSEGLIMIGLSIFVRRENDKAAEPTVPINEASIVSMAVSKNCASWELIESCWCWAATSRSRLLYIHHPEFSGSS